MPKFENSLNRLLDDFRAEFNVPGYDCSVWHNGREIYRRMDGVEDLNTGAPVTADTVYNLYSNTKVIACAAALQLYEQGRFLLEDELSRFFPEFARMKIRTPEGGIRDAAQPITLRDLFRMTSGIGDGPDYADMGMRFYAETDGVCSLSDLPKYLAEVPLLFEPGSRFKYGIGHEMLAALIEKLSGQRFSEYLEEHIFRPLGMEHTAFSMDRLPGRTLANQYTFTGKGRPLREEGAANCLVPPILKESASGGLISSVNDYMKFQQALAEGEALLSRRTVNLMRLNQLSGAQLDGYGFSHLGLGYGLGVRTTRDPAALGAPFGFGPFGWGGATGSYGSIDPENNLCIFYMHHVFGTEDTRLHNRLRNIVYAGLD